VATLLLGAGLANFPKLSELRKNLRLDAADQLAELPALLCGWRTTDSACVQDVSKPDWWRAIPEGPVTLRDGAERTKPQVSDADLR
jgi:hypothetical protein